ncbi:ATP-binding protein [Streptomyces sp. NBC_01267]|uniref:ATP-binding protein n=1 Tax=unclassified Streptomyces TaxID=2593676 RepID=UPI0020246670|nr:MULTISPECIES: ATP-binding protein [unclassified Streptomyces]MCX4552272.1 ATP-binding protein [Streptomyces sp. NBC_01500]WSC24829.1 ATP-binding protein [Streptomyces sp. NBC_01766]WSV58811.1 ATP-binding protein [Streptomyces sp. NBC_01014]
MDSPLADSATAREAATRFLSQNCPWADVDAVLLVISELAANAARHTTGWWRLRLSAEAELLVVEMDDDSPVPPVAREPDFAGGGGFGWHMVQKLAGRVEISPRPSGKTVRAIWSRPATG